MLAFVLITLSGCASNDGMPLGQYQALKQMCLNMGLKPAPVVAYKNHEQRMITKSLTCYDEYGAAFDLTKQ